MPTIFEFDANATSPQSFIILKDKDGREYRLQFDRDGGFVITKISGADFSGAILLSPIVSNQILFK